MKLIMVLKKESQQENRLTLPPADSSQKNTRDSRTNHGFYSPETTPSPTPPEGVVIPDFTGPMAAFAVSFFQDQLHASRLAELGITSLNEDLVDHAYNLASEYVAPGTNRAELRHDALVAFKALTLVSRETLKDWLTNQPEEISEVIEGLISHMSDKDIKDGALDEIIRLAQIDKQKPINRLGRKQ